MEAAAETFEILFEPDEGGYHVWCPAPRGCHSQGDTKDEARANIIEAIQLWLDGLAEPDQHPLERETVNVTFPHSDDRRS